MGIRQVLHVGGVCPKGTIWLEGLAKGTFPAISVDKRFVSDLFFIVRHY